MKKIFALLVLLINIIANISFSYDINEEDISKKAFEVTSIRTKAMGGAYRAICDDAYAIYFNPASLSLKNSSYFQLLGASLDFSMGDDNIFSLFSDASDIKDIDQANTNQNDINLIEKYTGSHNRIGITGPLNFVYTSENAGEELLYFNWGFGIIYQLDINFDFTDDENTYPPKYLMKAREDLGFVVASSFKLPIKTLEKNDINIYSGVSVKFLFNWISQNKLSESNFYNLSELSDGRLNLDSFTKVGNGRKFGQSLSADLGFLVNWKNLNLGISFTDFPGTTYSYSYYDKNGEETNMPEGAEEETVESDIDLSLSYMIPILSNVNPFWLKDIIFGFDVADCLDRDLVFWEKSHFGTEITTLDFIRLRAGVNQAYPSFGIGGKFPFIHIDLAYWGSEIGKKPNNSKREDNLGISISIIID